MWVESGVEVCLVGEVSCPALLLRVSVSSLPSVFVLGTIAYSDRLLVCGRVLNRSERGEGEEREGGEGGKGRRGRKRR